MAALRLVSVNIERSKHLDRVAPFIKAHAPDVLCLQELMEHDCEDIAQAHGSTWHSFVPMSRLLAEHPGSRYGLGVFSRAPVTDHGVRYYVQTHETLPETHPHDPATFNREHRMVLWGDVLAGDEVFRIATTHFTWTSNGAPDETQRRDVAALLSRLDGLGEFVLCGDFNAPRMRNGEPGEIFAAIAARYTDNIPHTYESSIDGSLHRAGPIPYMVDGLFSTPGYTVRDVALHTGVSDHCAITAHIERG